MADSAKRRATYEDVLAAPEHVIAEIIDGELRLHPRPAKPHAVAASALGEELGPPFKRGRGGPGGWILLFEPELHLADDILVPDLAGWRRERMPHVDATSFRACCTNGCASGSRPNARSSRSRLRVAVSRLSANACGCAGAKRTTSSTAS
jgi:hypothetical protein